MWVIVLFDLPVDTKKARKNYRIFRKNLLQDGFAKMQYSVYIRNCMSKENSQVHINRVTAWIPNDGEVRIMVITDKQFEKVQVFLGKKSKPPENAPKQLEMF